MKRTRLVVSVGAGALLLAVLTFFFVSQKKISLVPAPTLQSDSTANSSAKNDAPNANYWGHMGQGPLTTAPRGNLKAPAKLLDAPADLTKLYPDKSLSVYSIDIDSDGSQDYIVTEEAYGKFWTCFVGSDFHERFCNDWGHGDGFAFYWFIQLDESPKLELLALIGDTDFADFRLYKFDEQTWEPKTALRFHAVMASSADPNSLYWPNLPTIDSLILKTDSEIRIQAKVDHALESLDSEDDDRGFSNWLPVFYFEGRPTKRDPVDGFYALDKFQTYSLPDLVTALRAKSSTSPRQ